MKLLRESSLGLHHREIHRLLQDSFMDALPRHRPQREFHRTENPRLSRGVPASLQTSRHHKGHTSHATSCSNWMRFHLGSVSMTMFRAFRWAARLLTWSVTSSDIQQRQRRRTRASVSNCSSGLLLSLIQLLSCSPCKRIRCLVGRSQVLATLL